MTLIRSIKHQALALFVSFTLGISCLYLALAVIASFVVEDNIIDRLLRFEANHIEQTYQETGALVPARMDFIQIYPSYAELPLWVREALEQGLDDNEIFTPGDEHFHVKTLRLDNHNTGYLLAEVSPLLTVTNSPRIFEIFLWGLALTLIVAAVLAYKMAAKTVQPVMAMTRAVKQNQPLPELQYELGYLSKTMQHAFDALNDALQREKDFTTDVSHELRTPLTVLNNAVALAEQRGFQPSDLQQLKRVGQDMQHTIDVLLALARQESLCQQPCMLRSMVEQAGMQSALAAGVELELNIEMADELSINANAELLHLLLINLMNNAIAHGSTHQLWVRASGNQMVFHNEKAQGVPAEATRAGVKGASSKGIGQGLYLVTRIVDALGWQYDLQLTQSQFSIQISL
ncbi:HAMP domain-containing histidine kinase [Neiella marina]|uniref:histidine kinase n=1 Tax=Neiella holothuriorum TaxID=2870530 RepID=A0ABS7EFN3_9GAMM|nr:HAMP domain-containing sensor histidine kinase [Neiella holothuriorum]MBW8191128.1 HAMP domain-containing histidine kinase [Neiella holothuriorum]